MCSTRKITGVADSPLPSGTGIAVIFWKIKMFFLIDFFHKSDKYAISYISNLEYGWNKKRFFPLQIFKFEKYVFSYFSNLEYSQ